MRRWRVCRMEIWCEALGNPASKIDGYEGKRISAIMEKLGWTYGSPRRFKLYGNQRVYIRREGQ